MIEAGDGRIEVRFGAAGEAGPEDALLIEGNAPGAGDAQGGGGAQLVGGAPAEPDAPAARRAVVRFALSVRVATHPLGCLCCAPRGPVADALGRLFLARARGELPWFRSVVAVTRSAAGADAVRAALAGDVVTRARFRGEL